MKQAQIVAITNILNRFQNDISLPNDISYAFFKIGKLIQTQVEFQIKRQNELSEKYHCTQDKNGKLVFTSKEDAEAYEAEINELIDMDIDLGEFDKIPFKNDGRCNLSVHELMILEDFLEYV